jgi:hypothetical protein
LEFEHLEAVPRIVVALRVPGKPKIGDMGSPHSRAIHVKVVRCVRTGGKRWRRELHPEINVAAILRVLDRRMTGIPDNI